jgi:hypothetical protein
MNLTDNENAIIKLKRNHSQTWLTRSDWYWLIGLWEEVFELTFALLGLHHGPIEWELIQISAIAANWLEKRALLAEKMETT